MCQCHLGILTVFYCVKLIHVSFLKQRKVHLLRIETTTVDSTITFANLPSSYIYDVTPCTKGTLYIRTHQGNFTINTSTCAMTNSCMRSSFYLLLHASCTRGQRAIDQEETSTFFFFFFFHVARSRQRH